MKNWNYSLALKNHKPFAALISILIIIGIFFRFSNLDNKVYWLDESFTSLWISGYSLEEVQADISYNKTLEFSDLNKYYGDSNKRKGLSETIDRLATEDSQHPPFYYTLAYIWTQWTGSSIAGIRSLSALIGVLILPSIYWLSLEIFSSQISAWLAVCFAAVSPTHLIWAQEARQYSLFTLFITVSSAIFLRCLKKPNPWIWIAYCLSIFLGLYTHVLMSIFVGIQALYLISKKCYRKQRKRILIPFSLSLLASYTAFLPWAYFILKYPINRLDWTSVSIHPVEYIKRFFLIFVRVFVDFDFDFGDPFSLVSVIVILLIFAISFIHLVRRLDKGHNLFIFYLFIVPFLPFLAADIVMGGIRATVSRYYVGSFVGLELMVVEYLTHNLKNNVSKLIIGALITLGLFSSFQFNKSEFWWTKKQYNETFQIAKIVNQYHKPLILIPESFDAQSVLAISHSMDGDATFNRFSNAEPILKSHCGSKDIFLLNHPRNLDDTLEENGYLLASL
jgi:uncharacterized membrane protein